MIELLLIGIGTGNPDHVTLQGIKAINAADLILIPRKGPDKADLAELRWRICAAVLTNPAIQVVEFDLPMRDVASPDYLAGVEAWHDATAAVWREKVQETIGLQGCVAMLVWGDPSLYDSTLRIAARLAWPVKVIPGITAIQALTAAHGIALNGLGAPVLITTGRQLRDHGWPAGVDTLVVMLDGHCAFQTLDPKGISIWWAAYVGMAGQILRKGSLAGVAADIIEVRAKERATHGWIMDIYLLRRDHD